MNRERALKVVLVVVGLLFSRCSLSLDAVCEARACAGDDDEPLRHTRHFLAAGGPQSIGESQPDRLHGMVELCPRGCLWRCRHS